MPFRFYQGVLEPEHLELLARVLNRIVEAAPKPVDEQERHDIASRLLAAFSSGRRDEEELFRFCSWKSAASREASSRRTR